MGSGAKTPSALAPFSHDWIGGDIHGLSAYAGTLHRYVPEINDVATALDGKVKQARLWMAERLRERGYGPSRSR